MNSGAVQMDERAFGADAKEWIPGRSFCTPDEVK